MNQLNKQRLEITIETHNVTIIRTGGKSLSVFCHRCQSNQTVFAPAQVASFFRLTVEEVCSLVETDEFHAIDFGRDAALICAGSLKNLKNNVFPHLES